MTRPGETPVSNTVSPLLAEAAWPPEGDRAVVAALGDVEFLREVKDTLAVTGDVDAENVAEAVFSYGAVNETDGVHPVDAHSDAVMLALAQRLAGRFGWFVVPDPTRQERLAP